MLPVWTKTPEEAAGCVAAFRPVVMYPYHYADSDLSKLDAPLAGATVYVHRVLRDRYSS